MDIKIENNKTIVCDMCEGIYPESVKDKGEYLVPGTSEDGIAVWICRWCAKTTELWHYANDMNEIMSDAQAEHDKSCKNHPNNDKDPKPPLSFKPKLVQ